MIPLICGWCRSKLPTTPGVRFCGRKCRQAAWRLRRLSSRAAASDEPMRFAYADPPYPGTARKYYGGEASYAGEVDHVALVASLVDAGYDGWALSTSAKALRDVLPLCPAGARLAAWSKPHPPSPQTYGIHNCWEPVIVVGGRRRRPGVSDALIALPARGGGTLPGRKPIKFCAWLFSLLGMLPGDQLVDLFPGSGVVGAAWAELSSAGVVDAGVSDAPGASSACRGDDVARRRRRTTTTQAAHDDVGGVLERRDVAEDLPDAVAARGRDAASK